MIKKIFYFAGVPYKQASGAAREVVGVISCFTCCLAEWVGGGEGGNQLLLMFCVKMSLKRQVHAVYGRIAQPKPTKAVRGWQSTVKNGWGGL